MIHVPHYGRHAQCVADFMHARTRANTHMRSTRTAIYSIGQPVQRSFIELTCISARAISCQRHDNFSFVSIRMRFFFFSFFM